MDQASFDRMTRMLGGAASRRSGLRAALGAALGLAVTGAEGLEARGGGRETGRAGARPDVEGPCGNGTRRDNICTKDQQCCTNYCKKKLNNKDGKGRCRCIRKNRPCRPSQTCCGRYVCLGGICTLPAPEPAPGGIPTGKECVPGAEPCKDAAAACIPYYQGDPPGTYCLLPAGKACASAAECGARDCTGGVCVAEVCDVCEEGCPHDLVQDAVNAAVAGEVIRIGAGVYAEDLTVPNMDLTLTNCNGGAVTLRNVADGARTIVLGTSADSAPHKTVTIRNLTITGKGAPVAANAYPVSAPAVSDGGIAGYTNLIIEGTAKVTGCNRLDAGGGVYMGFPEGGMTLTVRGDAEVSNNFSSDDGGGIYIDRNTNVLLLLTGNARVTANYSTGTGGGVYTGNEALVEMSGNAEISHNRSQDKGAGAYIYCNTDRLCLKMTGAARIVFNTGYGTEGGGLYQYDNTDTYPNTIEMYDDTQISDNTIVDIDSYGAGIYSRRGVATLLMQGNATITRNTVANATTVTNGAGVYKLQLDIRDQAAIIGNSPGDCDSYTLLPGSKQCGVA